MTDPRPVGEDLPVPGLAAQIRRRGPVPFSEFVEHALYGPEGFYTRGGGAGRRRDFLTSPEVGPLFGAVVARALDSWWAALGRPDPFTVVEAGAGPGTLAQALRAAAPACAPALRYVLVERSPAMRAVQAQRLPLVPPAMLGAAVARHGHDVDDESVVPLPGQGPLFCSLAELPAAPVTGVVLANELLDNLPFDLLERTADGWSDVRVGLDGRGTPAEVLVPAAPPVCAWADRMAPDAPSGGRVPVQRTAAAWVGDALALVARGRLVVLDYASTTAAMAGRPWTEWVRTYRGQGRGGHPLDDPGSQDVTCEVALDQLAQVARPTGDRSQAEFLEAHGIGALVEEGRRLWQERAAAGDLAAVMARSRVGEAAALTDPAGLGAFRVLEWEVGGPGR